MESPWLSSRKQLRNLIVYLLVFFSIWTLRATLLYPIDENLKAISETWRQVYADTIRLLIFVLPVFLYLRFFVKIQPFHYLYLNTPINRKGLLRASLVVIFVFIAGVLLDYLLAGEGRSLSILVPSWGWGDIPRVLLGLTMAPISEEIFFRGFLLRNFQDFMDFWRADLLTAMAFVAIHWPYWLYSQGYHLGLITLSARIFIIGILLGYLVHKSNSLWPSILAHILNNFLSGILSYG